MYFDTDAGNKRRLLNVKSVFSPHGALMSSTLLLLYAFTKCKKRYFHSKFKITGWRTLVKHPVFVDAFNKLGEIDCVTTEASLSKRGLFAVCVEKPACKDINKLRHELTVQKFKKK